MKPKFLISLLLIFCVNISLLSNTYSFEELNELQREIVILNSVHEYEYNPHLASYTDEAQLHTGLYEGLFSYHPEDLSPIPALCSSYKTSRDKKRWTFTLREDAKFSDGTPILASDVKKSWIKLIQTKNAPFASLFDCIKGVAEYRNGTGSIEDINIEVQNDNTIILRLKSKAPHLPKILCHMAFSIVSEKENVYSGPFILKEKDEKSIVLEKNSYYWDSKNVLCPKIKILLSDDVLENAYQFNIGSVDWVNGNASADKIINKDSIHVSASFGTSYLFFKINNFPWDKPEIRTALLEAIPYDLLRKNYSIPAESFIYPLMAYPQVTGYSDYDKTDAISMMQEARKKYGIPEDEKLVLVFACTNNEYMMNQANILKEAWLDLGVELIPQTTSANRYNSAIPSWNADLFHYSWIGDFADPIAFLELFKGNSSLNISNYNNSKYNSLIEEALNQEILYDQYKLYAQAEQVLLDDGMLIPISHPINMHILNRNI